MIKRRKVFKITVLALIAFMLWICYFVNVISSSQSTGTKIQSQQIEEKIRNELRNLPEKYRRKKYLGVDRISVNFINSLLAYRDDELRGDEKFQINKTHLYVADKSLSISVREMKRSKITRVDLNNKGTQLKFLLTLDSGRTVIFKPKRYDKEEVIDGVVYAGKDRYGSEILGFYLSGLLNRALVPVSVERRLNAQKDIIPVASEIFLKTTFARNNRTCVYGICYYCTINDPVCTEDSVFTGAIIDYVNYKFKTFKSPWRRTYKKNLSAPWETDKNYCKVVLNGMRKERVLELIDVSIFDFLIQNGDRHHYELYYDSLVWLDNGKGLGNPYVDHIDILTPLYQCCMINNATWIRLQELSGGVLTESIEKMPDVSNFVYYKHFDALERRLLLVYATVELCISENRLNIVK